MFVLLSAGINQLRSGRSKPYASFGSTALQFLDDTCEKSNQPIGSV